MVLCPESWVLGSLRSRLEVLSLGGLLLKWRSDPNLELNRSRTHTYALRSACSAVNSIGAEFLNHGSEQQSAGRVPSEASAKEGDTAIHGCA